MTSRHALQSLRVGLLASHPIQYLSPLLRELARDCDLHVYYAHRQSAEGQAAAGYGVAFEWDSDLFAGYDFTFLENVARRPDVGRFDGCNCPELSEIIARGNFDAFIVTGWYLLAYWQAVTACRAHGVPVFVRGDSQLRTPRSWPKQLAKEFVTRWIVAQFDGFLSVGLRNREYLQRYGVPSDKIHWTPHFVDVAFFRDRSRLSAEERDSVRSEFGSETNEFVVLFVGRLIPLKRPMDLVLAAARLQNTLDVRLVFVGAGPLEADVRATAEQLGVKASFLGFRNQSELPRLYAASDVLALTSEQETWGLVVNEAAACGTPAIVVDEAGCSADIVVPGQTGMVYPSGDIPALSRAIQDMALLASSEDLRPHLEHMSERYSCEQASERTLTALRALATGRR
jgi:glycosyltransferase involved in cell wall biosynthesis